MLELALEQLPESALDGEILARSDSAGGSHDFACACRETRIGFSLGYAMGATIREQILNLPEGAWKPALNQDGEPREGAWVAELTDQLDLSSWPEGTRLICRRERPHPGAQLSFTDLDGHRFQCFITDQQDPDIAALEALHRQHAEVEDRVKTLKATGARAAPVPFLSGKRCLAGARPVGARHHGLDATADPRRRARHLRTQAAALPHPACRRANHPPCPAHRPAPARRLAVGRRDPPRIRAPGCASRLRLSTSQQLRNRTTAAGYSQLDAAQKQAPGRANRCRGATRTPHSAIGLRDGHESSNPVTQNQAAVTLVTNRG